MDIPSAENRIKENQAKIDEKPEDNKDDPRKKKNNDESWVLKDNFTKIRDNEGKLKEIKCLLCNSAFSSSTGNSTLQRHLAGCPKKPFEQKNKIQKKIEDYGLAKPKSDNQEYLENLLMNWVIISNQPLQEMDNPAFIQFVNGLNPHFKIPSRNNLKKKIEARYDEEKEKLKNVLSLTPYSINLTSDIWTSNANESYLSLTAHYLDSDWALKNSVLDIDKLPRPHTAKNIATRIFEILEDFDIYSKVRTLTTDAGKNMINSVEELGILGKKFYTNTPNDITHIPCAAHQLNRIVNSGLEEFECGSEKTISKLRQLISKIKRSPKLKEELECFSVKLNEKAMKLILDVPTRWNSTFDMLSRAISMRNSINMFIKENKKLKDLFITDEDWGLFKELVKLLKPFYDTTKKLCSSSQVTLPFRNFLFSQIELQLK